MFFIAHRLPRVTALAFLIALISGSESAAATLPVGSEEIAGRLRNLPAFTANPDEYRRGLRELQAQVPDLVPLLEEVLSGKDLKAARAAAVAIGVLPAPGEANALADVLLDPPLPERRVFEVLGLDRPQRIQGYSATDVELILLLRQAAATALGRIGGAAALDALGRLFRDGDLYAERFLGTELIVDPGSLRIVPKNDVQFRAGALLADAAQALAATDPVEASETFRKAINSPHEGVRRSAIRGLGLCARAPEPRELLIEFLQDEQTAAPVVAEVLQTVAREFSYPEMRTIVDNFSTKERCAPREFGLTVLDVATTGEFDRKPFQEDSELRALVTERMNDTCYNVAARASLLAHRLGLDEALLKALQERDIQTVAESFVFFIMLGQEGSEPVLIEALESEGGAAMSDAFMLSGNPTLLEAATAWREDSKRNARAEETRERSPSDLLSWGVIGEASGQ